MLMPSGEAVSAELFTGNDHHGVTWMDGELFGRPGDRVPVVKERDGKLVLIEEGDVIFRYATGFGVGRPA